MQIDGNIVMPREVFWLCSLSMIVGFVALIVISLAVIVGALWAASTALMLFLAHVSSTQLLIMLVIAYAAYQAGQAIKRRRCVL